MPFHPSAVGDYPKSAELLRAFIEQHDGCQWHGIDLDRCVLFVSSPTEAVHRCKACAGTRLGDILSIAYQSHRGPCRVCDGTGSIRERKRSTIPATWAGVRRWLGY